MDCYLSKFDLRLPLGNSSSGFLFLFLALFLAFSFLISKNSILKIKAECNQTPLHIPNVISHLSFRLASFCMCVIGKSDNALAKRINYKRKSHIEDSYMESLTQHSDMINNNLFSKNLNLTSDLIPQ